MYLKRITDRDIRGKGVVGMADTPNLSPEEMQRKVEEILRDVVIPTMNENADKTVSKEDLRKFSYEAGIGDMYAGYYDKNKAPFKVEDVNWDELSGIGILKDELEQAGELETLLRGEKTGVVSLSLVLLGVDVVMDATLQLVRKNDSPLLEIIGINPTQ